MSLPLTRRIAGTALLLGAAAAPLIGAGAAHADTPRHPLGAVSSVDGAALGSTVDGPSHQASGSAARSGGQAVRTALPAAGRIVGATGGTAAPAARQTAAQATDATGRLVGATAESAGSALPGAESLPVAALPNAGALPASGLPTTDRLPLKGLPLT